MQLIEDLEKKYGIAILPAEIKGNRWSCLEIKKCEIPLSQPFRIQVSQKRGYIIYSYEMLDKIRQDELLQVLKTLEVQ